MKKISVILATLNRNQLLLQCLNSLHAQTRVPDEIIVIDNSPHNGAKTVVNVFARTFPHVRYISQHKRGISFAKNRGIREAKNDILAFIDDDCIADKKWVATILSSYKKGVNANMGKNLNANPDNLYSCLEYYHTQRSILARLQRRGGNAYSQLVDPKNFSIRKDVLYNNGISFDETFGGYAGLEEVDFSKRLEKRRIEVSYNPLMVVSHHGRTNFLTHTIREYKAGRALHFFYMKRRDEIDNDIEHEKSKPNSQKKRALNEIRRLRSNILEGKPLYFRILFRLLDLYSRWIKRLGYIMEQGYQ